MAYNAVRFGQNDAVLALGFEKMQKGPLENQLPGLEKLKEETEKEKKPPIAARMFGDAGRDHMEKYGTKKETFAKIAVKNHRHSVNNPRSQYQQACTIEEVFASRLIYDPLTILQCCPTSDGAAAAVLVSEDYLKKHATPNAVEIVGMQMTTDKMDDFSRGAIGMVGMGMTERAAKSVYEQAGAGPEDAQVIELHDCFSTNELITYEGLGLCKGGEGERLVEDDATSYGGKWVVNPSGGLLSKGHPLGATGLAQCAELNWQLRGQAEQRQVFNYYKDYGLQGSAQQGQQQRGQSREEATVPLVEEHLKVGKRQVEAGGVRLRKIVRTENINQPVELRREEIKIERVPGQGAQVSGKAFAGEDIYIPLRREEPVIQKDAQVREQVRVQKTASTDRQQVSEQVCKEDVEIEESGDASRLHTEGAKAANRLREQEEKPRSQRQKDS